MAPSWPETKFPHNLLVHVSRNHNGKLMQGRIPATYEFAFPPGGQERYRLRAVGASRPRQGTNVDCGHYVCYARLEGTERWVLFDDSKCTPVSMTVRNNLLAPDCSITTREASSHYREYDADFSYLTVFLYHRV